MSRFVPNAIHSIQVSRKLLQLVDVLISSIVSTALTLANKFEHIGLSLVETLAQPLFCVIGNYFVIVLLHKKALRTGVKM